YRWDGSSWVQEQKLLASDGAAGDHFGISVSVSGDVTVVGARLDDDNGTDAGSAYVYRWDGSSWAQEQKLLASDGAAADIFGHSVSVSGDVAVVGAYYDDDDGTDSGSAYVYRWDGSSWVQEQKLLASDAEAGVEFFDVDAHLLGWLGALQEASAVSKAIVDFGELPDFQEGHSDPVKGPLCAEGNNIVPPGFLPDNLCVTSHEIDHLDYVGPFGLGNPKNAVVAGRQGPPPIDSFDMVMSEPVVAVEFFALVLLSDDMVNIEVFDINDLSIGFLLDADAPQQGGHRWGVLATGGDTIGRVNLRSQGGFEGIMDVTLFVAGCPWDLNGDSVVDITDLLALLAAWGDNPGHPADIDHDGVVGIHDLLALLANWGSCP
ncbi:MAG: hypothetical protein ACYS0G_00005, partial [Planctomycetota bacterium]